jgi:hypothetical protein
MTKFSSAYFLVSLLVLRQRYLSAKKKVYLNYLTMKKFIMITDSLKGHELTLNRRGILIGAKPKNQHFCETYYNAAPQLKFNKKRRDNALRVSRAILTHPIMEIEIDFDDGLVIKKYPQNIDVERFEHDRSMMLEYYSGVPFKRVDHQFTENLLNGRVLDLNTDRKEFKLFVRRVHEYSTVMIGHGGAPTKKCLDVDEARNVIKFLRKKGIELNIQLFLKMIGEVPWIITKGKDLSGTNLIVQHNKIFSIDWEPLELKLRPFYCDTLLLIFKTDTIGVYKGNYDNIFCDLLLYFDIKQAVDSKTRLTINSVLLIMDVMERDSEFNNRLAQFRMKTALNKTDKSYLLLQLRKSQAEHQ